MFKILYIYNRDTVLNIQCFQIRRFKSIMNDMKVLVSSPDVPKSAVDILSARFKTTINQERSRESLLMQVRGVDAVLWATKVKLDKEMIDAAGPQLKMVGTMSAGVDHIDVEELKKRNIKLSNAAGEALNAAVANIAILLALAASRRLHEGRQIIENGSWKPEPQWIMGQDIDGSVVGIVGLGGIGQAIIKRLKPFQIKKFLYCGHKEKEEGKQLEAEFVSFDKLLKESDFVIVSCPVTPETEGMFNENAFNKMKKTAVFVNVARGTIVDQPALVKALKNETIFAAGLDVMTPEPLPKDHELLKLPNCVLIPHFGSATSKTRVAMVQTAAKNIVMGLSGEPLSNPVY